MRKFLVILGIIFLLSPGQAAAQHGSISGTVKASDGTELPGAAISVLGTELATVCDTQGCYRISGIKPGVALVLAALDGFVEQQRTVVIKTGNTTTLDFALNYKTLKEERTVIAERPLLSTSEKTSQITLTPRQIETLPSLGEKDIFRAFQLLPGISGSNEASSGLYVRGGTPDQNLILYDGFTIYHVDHLFGYFSAFNMEAVDEVTLNKGGFESKYGGRLSSVMELMGRSGPPDEFNFGAGASFLSFNALAEIPFFGRGSLVLAGRRSFQSPLYNSIADMFSDGTGGSGGGAAMGRMGGGGFGGRMGMFETEPKSHFYDINARADFSLSRKDLIVVSFYNGKDKLDNSRTMQLPPFIMEEDLEVDFSGEITDLTGWGNTGLAAFWARDWSDTIQTKLTGSFSRYFYTRDRSSSMNLTPSWFDDENEEENRPRFNANNGMGETNELTDLTLKLDNTFDIGRNNTVSFGGQILSLDIRYDYGVDLTEEQDDDINPPKFFVGVLDRDDSGKLYSAYLQDRWTLFDALTITSGLRITSFDRTGEIYYEPRASLTLRLTPHFKLKGAWGKYYQFVNRITREDFMQGNQEFWMLSGENSVPVSSAVHYIAGMSYETEELLFDIEAYSKDLDGIVEFAPRSRDWRDDVDYEQFFYQGTGKTQGLEFLFQKKFGDYTGWLSYTLSKVTHTLPDLQEDPYPALHDQKHELKLVQSYDLGDWNFSGTWIYASGRPYTAMLGFEEITGFRDRILYELVVGEKNAARLPPYHRLDLSASYAFNLGDTDARAGLTLFNLYDHKNIWYKEFDVIEQEIIETDVLLRGFTVNLYVNLKF